MTVEPLADIAASIHDGATIALGGKTLHRAPMAFVRALARAGTADLTLIGLAKSIDVDLLCAMDRARAVHYGHVGFEHLGLAPNARRAAEAGTVDAHEGTCYTVATMLRAARQGVPFLPIAGLGGSDLVDANPAIDAVDSPFTGDRVRVVRALRPDVGVIHATAVDERGNARIAGADLTERLVAASAERVIVTAERLAEPGTFAAAPERTAVPHHLVDSVAVAPFGAHPTSCPGGYDYDTAFLEDYLGRSRAGDVDGTVELAVGPDEDAYRRAAVDDRAPSLEWDAPGTAPGAVEP